MKYIGNFIAGTTVRGAFNTRKADGTPITFGGSPALSVYKDASVTETTTGVTLTVDFDSRTGHHVFSIVTSDIFYSAGSDFRVVVTSGTVDGISVVGAEVASFSIGARADSSYGVTLVTLVTALPSASAIATAVWASGTRTLTSFGTLVSDIATAVWGAATRSLTTFGTLASDVWAVATRTITGGTVSTVSDKTGYSLTQAFPTNFASLAITGGGAVTAGTVSDKTGYSLSQAFPANFSSLAITVGGAITAGTVSDKTGYSLTQAFPTNFSALSIDASGRTLLQPTQAGVTIPTVTSITNGVTVTTNNDKTGYSLTVGERGLVADAVWDEATSGHTTAGTTGAAIITASSAGDPWATALPGSYAAGTAGHIVGNNLNATVSSRSTLDAAGVWAAATRTITGGTVTTVSDKTGYSLAQAFPTNFAALSIDASGRTLLQPTQTGVTIPTVTNVSNGVTVTTNNDKTGYSLTQAFPSNFASMAITVGGAVTAGTVSDKTGYSLATAPPTANAIASQVRTELTTELGRIDVATSTRLASGSYTAPPSSSTIATDVWAAATRTITGGTITTVSDKTGYSLTQAFPANFASLGINVSGHISRVTLVDTCTTNTDMRGTNNALLASSYTAPDNAGIAAIKAKTDTIPAWPTNFAALSIDVSGRVLLQPTQTGVTIPTVTTVTDKAGYSLATAPPTAAAIATQVRTELTTELGRIDAAVSSRLASASYTAPNNAGISSILAVTNKLDTAMEVDGLVYRFTANALEMAPTSSGGDATQAKQDQIIALINGGKITSIAPVSTTGTITGPIVIGDDYLASSNRAFDWFVDPAAFSIGSATCWFGGARSSKPTESTWLVQGSVAAVTVDGQPKWRLRFELTTSQTAALIADKHNWSVELRGPSGPENITKISGTVQVVTQYTNN